MSAKKLFVFIVALLVMMVMWAMGDAAVAGVLSFVVLLFDASASATVFKWVFLGLLIIEFPLTAVYFYNHIKND